MVQPSVQGAWLELRHTKALASWANTTVANAAPEACARIEAPGRVPPGAPAGRREHGAERGHLEDGFDGAEQA